jgi:hypothetical protein
MSDVDLAVQLLRETPTHENRPENQLRQWAETALSYADTLPPPPSCVVQEKTGGVHGKEVVLAEFHHRTKEITVYRDSLELLAKVGGKWHVTVPQLREAAVAHELAHHVVDVRDLNKALGHTALRVGPWRLRGHVAGADEIVAHRYAHRHSSLGPSPLLLTAALAARLGG